MTTLKATVEQTVSSRADSDGAIGRSPVAEREESLTLRIAFPRPACWSWVRIGLCWLLSLWLSLCVVGLSEAFSQTRPTFAVASIKPNDRGKRRSGELRLMPGGEEYAGSHVSVRLLIVTAYGLADNQILGAPEWVNSSLYDIDAKADHPSSPEQLDMMLQSLLEDRFGFRQHIEIKDLLAYGLALDKTAKKLRIHDGPFVYPVLRFGAGRIQAQGVTISEFAKALARRLGRPVLDETNLLGQYDFLLEWPAEAEDHERSRTGVGNDSIPGFSSAMFLALREQIGLKLESKKSRVDVHVIDRINKPSSN